MINVDELTEEDKGRWVTYRAGHNDEESGRLKGWSPWYAFVVYKCGGHWDEYQNYTGQCTKFSDLDFKPCQ